MNKYFNADVVNGIYLIDELEYHCLKKQIKKYCRKFGHMETYRLLIDKNLPELINSLNEEKPPFKDFEFNVNPYTCEGSRKGRVYYEWGGQIHYTESLIGKFLIRVFFKQIKPINF